MQDLYLRIEDDVLFPTIPCVIFFFSLSAVIRPRYIVGLFKIGFRFLNRNDKNRYTAAAGASVLGTVISNQTFVCRDKSVHCLVLMRTFCDPCFVNCIVIVQLISMSNWLMRFQGIQFYAIFVIICCFFHG